MLETNGESFKDDCHYNEYIEYEGKEPTISEVFNLSKDSPVFLDLKNMPVELESILDFVEEKNFVQNNIERIIFTLDSKNPSGIVNEKTIFINSGKNFGGKLNPRDEIDIFDEVIYEAKRIENIHLFEKNPVLLEKEAREKQLKALEKLYLSVGSNNLNIYLKNRIKEVEGYLSLLNRP